MMKGQHNISAVDNESTATTNATCAAQRAHRLSMFTPKRVIELCVGPSLFMLEEAYKIHNIECFGNDIDTRWLKHHKTGRWLFGDALTLAKIGALRQFDVAIFAPPLTVGCTGERIDALDIFDVTPGYLEFVDVIMSIPHASRPKLLTLVLHGKVLSTPQDRADYHKLLSELWRRGLAPHPTQLIDGCRKYVDIDISLSHPSGWHQAVEDDEV